MPATHVALLRAVNLGPHNSVAMANLRSLASRLGVRSPRTLLRSGNLVFEVEGSTPVELERLFEAGASARLHLQTEFFVRTAAEWQAIIAGNPFPSEAAEDPSHLVVMCLKAAPSTKAVASLRTAIVGRERVRVRGREAYLTYPDGIGNSTLTIRSIERTLGVGGTGRNWNTVLKIGALLGWSA